MKRRLPYFWVFSSFGNDPSWTSAASSSWLATSFCYNNINTTGPCLLSRAHLFQCHPICNQQCYSRIQITDIFLKDEIFLRLTGNLRFQFAQRPLCSSQLIANFQVFFLYTHADVERGHRDALRLPDRPAIMARKCILSCYGLEGRR